MPYLEVLTDQCHKLLFTVGKKYCALILNSKSERLIRDCNFLKPYLIYIKSDLLNRTLKMACHILFIFILTFSIISGSFVDTDVEDIRVTAKDSEIRVTGSFHLDILDKTRGKVLEKIRANLEVSSELVKTPNLSVKVELWCPTFNSLAFRLTPVTRVKRQDNTTKLYLDFPWRDEQCTKCFKCRHWNFTVIFKTNDKGVASLNKQAITIEKIKAYFQGKHLSSI